MDTKTEKEGIKHMERIEHQLGEIKRRSQSSKRAFLNGIFSGMGAIAGSILAVAILGWVLSLFGVIPGFDTLAEYIRGLMSSIRK
jgi:hypothetical protein